MCLNARTIQIHVSTKHQLFPNNAEHVFNISLISYLEICHLILKIIQTLTINYIVWVLIQSKWLGTFTWKQFCWVPCVLILYKCLGLRIFVLYIVKLIIRKGLHWNVKTCSTYTLWATTISRWTLWMLELNVI